MASIFTIATASHLSQALACMLSAASHANDLNAKIYVLDRDFKTKIINGITISPVPTDVQHHVTQTFPADYSWSEVCFAMKPKLMEHEISLGAKLAAYIDSDILFFGDITPTLGLAENQSVGLVPHYLHPRKEGDHPSDLTLLRSGTYNGGFITAKSSIEGIDFLTWWGGKSAKQGYNRPREGMCGDQRWLDPVPVLFDSTGIFRNEGLNVAYWNLNERPISVDQDGQYIAGRSKLIFFHFSGFKLKSPNALSIHAKRNFRGTSDEIISNLCNHYASTLMNCVKRAHDALANTEESILSHWHRKGSWSRILRWASMR